MFKGGGFIRKTKFNQMIKAGFNIQLNETKCQNAYFDSGFIGVNISYSRTIITVNSDENCSGPKVQTRCDIPQNS